MNGGLDTQMTRQSFVGKLGGTDSSEATAVVICERDAKRFQEEFVAAAGTRSPVFLANPDWGARERGQFDALVERASAGWDPELGWLMVPTGGSSGDIKLARHDQRTIAAAVSGYLKFWGIDHVDGVGVLPLYHVGGLMAWLRCVLTGGEYRQLNWRDISEGKFPSEERDGTVVSMVPTQLQALRGITGGADWLRQFGAVLVGGAALPSTLRNWARENRLPLSPSYGMTESMAMVCAMPPQNFLAGEEGVGRALPHVDLAVEAGGEIGLASVSLFRGYWPLLREELASWFTGDLGEVDEAGRLTVTGRRDDLIISGGEKIDPTEVAGVVGRIIDADQILVLGLPDEHWGQVAVLFYCAEKSLELTDLRELLVGKLTKYKWPKRLVKLDTWPVNAVGKVDRSLLRRLAEN